MEATGESNGFDTRHCGFVLTGLGDRTNVCMFRRTDFCFLSASWLKSADIQDPQLYPLPQSLWAFSTVCSLFGETVAARSFEFES